MTDESTPGISFSALPEGCELDLFKPCIVHIEGLDMLVFLMEDCSYVEHQVNQSVSLLMHEGRVVGVQLHGYSIMLEAITHRL